MWNAVLLAGAVVGQPDAPNPTIPVALVTGVKGEVMVNAGPAVLSLNRRDDERFHATRVLAVGDHLLAADRVRLPATGSVNLLFLKDGKRYRLKPGRLVDVQAEGYEPRDAGELVAGPATDPGLLKAIREAYSHAPAGRVNRAALAATQLVRPRYEPREEWDAPRSGPDPSYLLRRVSPMDGATVLSTRPALRWTAAPGVTAFDVSLEADDFSAVESKRGIKVWTRRTTASTLQFPDAEKELNPRLHYRWQVVATIGETTELVARAEFRVADPEVIRGLGKVGVGEAGDDPIVWLAAAQAFNAHGIYDRSLPLYERLAAASPRVDHYQEQLVYLYYRAGWLGAAKAAERRVSYPLWRD